MLSPDAPGVSSRHSSISLTQTSPHYNRQQISTSNLLHTYAPVQITTAERTDHTTASEPKSQESRVLCILFACGSPPRAPTAVHLVAATTAAKSRQRFGSRPVAIPYSMLPMKASPAPVVSTMASCRRQANHKCCDMTQPAMHKEHSSPSSRIGDHAGSGRASVTERRGFLCTNAPAQAVTGVAFLPWQCQRLLPPLQWLADSAHLMRALPGCCSRAPVRSEHLTLLQPQPLPQLFASLHPS